MRGEAEAALEDSHLRRYHRRRRWFCCCCCCCYTLHNTIQHNSENLWTSIWFHPRAIILTFNSGTCHQLHKSYFVKQEPRLCLKFRSWRPKRWEQSVRPRNNNSNKKKSSPSSVSDRPRCPHFWRPWVEVSPLPSWVLPGWTPVTAQALTGTVKKIPSNGKATLLDRSKRS